jgi:hypothetical protein
LILLVVFNLIAWALALSASRAPKMQNFCKRRSLRQKQIWFRNLISVQRSQLQGGWLENIFTSGGNKARGVSAAILICLNGLMPQTDFAAINAN